MKAEVDKGMEILRSGTAESWADAARQANCTPQALTNRWGKEEDEAPTFAKKPSVVETATETATEEVEPTPAEKELASKVVTLSARASARTAEATAAKNDLADAKEQLEKAQRELDLAIETKNVQAPDWMSEPVTTGHRGTLLSLFSDFHAGEYVDPAEMVWYNAYSTEIAEQRLKRFFEKTITVSRNYLAGVKYDGIVMASLGDTISGEIHDEFKHTNELSNYEAVPFVVPLITEGIGMLADEFGKVHVPCVPGNHPRDSRLPRYKGRSKHNADTLVSKLVASEFRNDDRVTFDIPAALSADFTIYDTCFRAEHGDEATGGSGIQGAMLPISLLTHRRRKQAQAEGFPFDVILLGHWHQYMPMVTKGWIVNGAGKGYDEYAKGKGFEPERAQQALAVVTPEHGISMQAPLFVGDRTAEGW